MNTFRPDRCLGSIPLVGLALGLLLAGACATEATGGGTGGTSGGGRGGAFLTGGAPGSGGTGSGGSGSGGSVATGGNPAIGTGGAGTGGSASGGTGSGGTASGGAGIGGSGIGASGGSAGTSAGGAAVPACPANATFCSGFEEQGMPTGAVYRVNAAPGDWGRDFALDATKSRAGRASLRVKASTEAGTSGSAYKMLSVPSPMTSFWVRFFMWSELDLGAVDHNPFAVASGSDDPNDSGNLEFADDAGIAFNFHDDVRWPEGYSRTNRFTLPKATWHCIEVFYDSGPARNQQLFINGMQRINITGWPSTTQLTTTFKVFKFGFNELHGPPRQTWYDDVVVAPQRIPCQ